VVFSLALARLPGTLFLSELTLGAIDQSGEISRGDQVLAPVPAGGGKLAGSPFALIKAPKVNFSDQLAKADEIAVVVLDFDLLQPVDSRYRRRS
jgi:hypothetical protein